MADFSLDIPTRFESCRLILRSYGAGDGPILYAAGQRNHDHLLRYESENALMSITDGQSAEALALNLAAGWSARRYYFIGGFDKATSGFVCQGHVGCGSSVTIPTSAASGWRSGTVWFPRGISVRTNSIQMGRSRERYCSACLPANSKNGDKCGSQVLDRRESIQRMHSAARPAYR
jgi:hypothetical protein